MKRLYAYLIVSAFFVVACGNDDKPAHSTQPVSAGKANTNHLPIVSIEHEKGYIFENEKPEFVVTRTGDALNELEVNVSVSETGDMVAATDEGAHTVLFNAGEKTAEVCCLAITPDTADEDHSTVTAEITANDEYTLDPDNNSASVQVRDDDGTLIELSLDPLDQVVGEGGAAQFYFVATSVDDGTFTVIGDLTRVFGETSSLFSFNTDATTLNEAQSPADYLPVSNQYFLAYADYLTVSDQYSLSYADFKIAGDRLVLRQTLPPVQTVRDDDEQEDDERFLVKLVQIPLDPRISFVSGKTTGTVTISHIADGALRLVGGTSEREGLLEVFHNGEWGTICDDYWTDDEAEVACRQLGFEGFEANFLRAEMGQGTGPIWMDNVNCAGADTRLADCVFGQHFDRTWGDHNCLHSEDVGLRCK